ncbi:tRNA pseudouridine(55) synthase TruB [Jeongeupia naejangsanensis]|uniref:tRNA pseudouridine synthase B n=1 Tax=Jeongeupia naejangsanensis TaxID=613195 RepID=A0ABS2BI73_9NEIS|nr:tRNA pseudouridine(55) synthase TruB [Jeongeupia naejangsanensis]MBM3114514.1 tRNA pseudouridine(55) synthase TruB [Jeongeupia naejangsanensis]
MAKRKIDGVLLLDKPFGITSNAAMMKCRWLLSAEKGGHTGVLDPFATGLLPLCFGEATKFAQRMLDADKGYRATIRLGQVSTTLDGEGEVTDSGVAPTDRELIDRVLASFVGEIDQVPPMHSALKHQGKALYEYARQGIEIERAARRITIYSITTVSFSGAELVIDVACSKGTYIRTLADDIGRALGCGAYLTGLRRTKTAGFSIDQAVSLEAYIEMPLEAREACLLPADVLVQDMPLLTLDADEVMRCRNGMSVRRSAALDKGLFRLYAAPESGDNARFLGLGEVACDGVLRPKRLLATSGQ